MQNKKVYLAKSNLASGLDFEYVKSSLLRIPDIEIIEYGDGIEPSECTCFVYVPLGDFLSQENGHTELYINKNVYNELDNFILSSDKEDPYDNVFVYLGKSANVDQNDIETTTPYILRSLDSKKSNIDVWEKYGEIDFDPTQAESLLKFVNHCIKNKNDDWLNNTRYYIPEKEYALPPIPEFEKRRSRGTTRVSNSSEVSKESVSKKYINNNETAQYVNTVYGELISGKKPRLRR